MTTVQVEEPTGEPIPRRAIELVVGDRIAAEFLPRMFGVGPAEVAFVSDHRFRSQSFVFVAVKYADGYYDSTSFLSGAELKVWPAAKPVEGTEQREHENARLQALLWKRDVGSFGSAAAALANAHARALVDDNDRAKELIQESMTPADEGRVANPNLAYFLAVRENRLHDRRTCALAELREAAERARKIADIRAFADWLEQNAWAPMPYSFDAGVHLDERHVGGPSVAEAYATVLKIAPMLDAEIEDRLDDRTAVRKSFGSVEYDVIAWHPNGRPADSAPPAPSAVRQELLWKREAGTRGSLTAALEHAYDMALLEDNDRATKLVEASMTAADEGRVANPNLAYFLAVRENRRRRALASAE